MAEDKNYIDILNKARRRRKRNAYSNYIILAVALAALIGAVVFIACMLGQTGGNGEPAAADASSQTEENGEMENSLSPEEEAVRQEAEAKQAVVDSYQNMGLVQLENGGYLNIRETPDTSGKIIGSLMENSVCEIIESEGDWSHITSGGVEGYISNRYVVTGDEARQKALGYVTEMAIVNVKADDKLNIRSEPNADSAENVVGQALRDERYPVLEKLDGWIQIEEGYISADYATVQLALNEGRKLDLRTMALNQYDNLIISKVKNYLNIRKEMNMDDDSNIIGKFPSQAAGEILETLDGWYKIKSGPITGYVKADSTLVAIGQEARDLALEAASLTAIVNTDMLNVRSEPNTDAKIWTQISKEERYTVLNQLDGWVEIELDAGDGDSEDKAYISTRDNNVEVRYALTEAIKFSPLEEKANREASLRNKVVNYALQFVGGRYVWGGNDPHTGADCSGFVKYVLNNMAGVSLPRTSREQAKVGKSISSSEMRPGDLIFYTGSNGVVNHVALYIGNGQIVHAASRKSGIKISTWNYRKPKAIRNVLD